ncbi:MAG: phosphoribosylanthranilate isomerase [Halarsenatibacteraceae bacterium]
MPQLTKQATKIKICGMTNQEDIASAVSLNVDALGFILAKSPRQVTLNQARELTAQLPPFIDTVAVVVNPDKNELAEIVSSRIFTAIQFHGSENLESFQDIPLKTIKAISISDKLDLEAITKYQDQADYLLFDTKIGDKTGGTGESFDWRLLKKTNLNKNYILAGGLGPDNIREALNRLNPAAVDLNSRLESSPGKKDPELMKESVNLIKTHNKRN